MYGDVPSWGALVETQKTRRICTTLQKQTQIKNPMVGGHRCLLQPYWYKVPALHISHYLLMVMQ